jgi:dTDP-4-dehydrorhamnose 3,5-epimerase
MGLNEVVQIYPLKRIPSEHGEVKHMIKSDSPYFKKFGEVYFSLVNPAPCTGWKRHLTLTQNLTVPMGLVKFVVFNEQKTRVQELVIGDNNYQLIVIPPKVWYSFKNVGNKPALIANCTDLPHDSTQVERLELINNHIPYVWENQ